MEERLKTIFGNVNDWLKFAEAKNGVLITLNGGAIFAFISSFKDKLTLSGVDFLSAEFLFRIFCLEFLACCLISLLISLLSFLPQTKEKVFFFPPEPKRTNDNPLYFGDIQKYTAVELLDLIKDNHQSSYTQMEKHYASQIVINSIITDRKVKYFKLALFFTISSIVSIFIGILLYILFNPNE